MADVSTPTLPAAVSNASGLGSFGVGANDVAGAISMIEATRARTDRAINVNLFVHALPRLDEAREQSWIRALRHPFESYGTETPSTMRSIYENFADDELPSSDLMTPQRIVAEETFRWTFGSSMFLATLMSLPNVRRSVVWYWVE